MIIGFKVLSVVTSLFGISAISHGASEALSGIPHNQLQPSALRTYRDSLSRRPSESESTAIRKKPKSAAPLAPAAESTEDIEIWLGEGIGRFGDYEFSVLGGKPDHPTPTGAFKIEWKSRKWWSKQYDAPMPYSCFFHRGAAIHEGSLRTRSHGCIHVSNEAAKRIYGRGKEKVTRVFVYP